MCLTPGVVTLLPRVTMHFEWNRVVAEGVSEDVLQLMESATQMYIYINLALDYCFTKSTNKIPAFLTPFLESSCALPCQNA